VTKIMRLKLMTLMVMASAIVVAQEAPVPATPTPTPARSAIQEGTAADTVSIGSRAAVQQVPLKIQLTLARYQGEKKLSSTPYTMWVTANEPRTTKLRMGVQIPVPAGTAGFTYRNVGTDIDCTAGTGAPGTYKLGLTVSDSSVYFSERDRPAPANPESVQPSFRSFTATFNILLRDGQTAQYTTATDQVSGEVMKIDATLTVLK
jgi:hypothetical protein